MDPRQPAAQLRRLERRIATRVDLRNAWRRVWGSVPAVGQIVIAVAAAYSIARWGLGHEFPLLAVTVTISSLGLARDARPRRVLETAGGIIVGITLSEALSLLLGYGLWQILLILTVTLLVARAVSPNPAFAMAASIQSMLVVILQQANEGPFFRVFDGLIGGAMALAVTALIPRDPRRTARRDGRALFSVLEEGTGSVVSALGSADSAAAELGLGRLRRTQQLVDNWSSSLDTAVSVARIAPLLRRHLPELRVEARILTAADLAARHLRPIARRVDFLVRDGEPRPALSAALGEIATGIRLLGAEIDDRELAGASRSLLTDVARRLDPSSIVPSGALADSMVVIMLRPLVVDLLVGCGADADDARALLPPV